MSCQKHVEEMEVAVRAWAVPDDLRRPAEFAGKWQGLDPGPSEWSVTFDTETATDAGQRVRVGAYQVRNGDDLVEAGFFYDPKAITVEEVEVIRSYALSRRLRVLTRDEF